MASSSVLLAGWLLLAHAPIRPMILWPTQYEAADVCVRDAKRSMLERKDCLQVLLRPESPLQSQSVAWALAEHATPEIHAEIWSWCTQHLHPSCVEHARSQASTAKPSESALAVLRAGSPATTLELAQAWLRSNDQELRMLAVEELALLPATLQDDLPRQLLLEVLRRERGDLRALALHRLGGRGPGPGVDAVLNCLLDLDPNLRLAALATLGSLQDVGGAIALHREVWLPADSEAQRVALHSLVEIPGDVTSRLLAELISNPPPELTLPEIASALRKRQHPSPEIIEALVRRIDGGCEDPIECTVILETLELLGPAAAPMLRSLLQSNVALASMSAQVLRAPRRPALRRSPLALRVAAEDAAFVPTLDECNLLRDWIFDSRVRTDEQMLAATIWLRCATTASARTYVRDQLMRSADLALAQLATIMIADTPSHVLETQLSTLSSEHLLAPLIVATRITRADIATPHLWRATDRLSHPSYRVMVRAALLHDDAAAPHVLTSSMRPPERGCRLALTPESLGSRTLRWYFCAAQKD